MRPPLLSDDSIRAAIRELAAKQARITGVAVRALLAARYGARGGVARIYRFVNDARADTRRAPIPEASAFDAAASSESREAAITRADLAEHRERTHQERWARETDALRLRLAAAEQAARDVEAAKQRVADLTRALSSAQARIARLERSRVDDRQ
jgi:hypothetical protein